MKSIHIIMPMAGAGRRVSDKYSVPKPFIKLYDKFLFDYSLSGMLSSIPHNIPVKTSMIIRNDMLENSIYWKNILNKIVWDNWEVTEFNLITIDELTRGSLETVMCAKQYIDDDDICFVLDCDLSFFNNGLRTFIDLLYNDEIYADGFLCSFESNSDKYSYAEIDDEHNVIRTVEKNPISNHALAGVYGFASGQLLKRYANECLENVSEYNEYYVSSVYNKMINDNKIIKIFKCDEYVSLGTSEEIDEFKNSNNDYKELYITDLDGTLVDTREANYLAYKETFSSIYNYDLSKDTYYSNFGLRIDDLLKYLNLDVNKISDVKRLKSELYKKYLDKIKINITLYSMLLHKKQNTHKISLATTASYNNVMSVLNHFGISNLFDYIVTGEDVSVGKPDPETYNKIIYEFNYIDINKIYIFEDSDVGILAAEHSNVMQNNIININKTWNGMHYNYFVDINEFNDRTHRNTNNILL